MPARETVVFALTLKKTDKSEIGEVVLGHIRVALTRCSSRWRRSTPNPAGPLDVLGHYFFRALNRELGPFEALRGTGDFGRHRDSPAFRDVCHEIETPGGRNRSLTPARWRSSNCSRWIKITLLKVLRSCPSVWCVPLQPF
ncbi:hypothetical protein EOD14_19185 [Mesorhizobium sp. M7A.T.Ca.US.000.02.1.1]|nr:hypothetical protein EOD14_19185 [Mesorhizobium sp. M7A.T.Ca.US.000.02.1.1]RUU83995.1 hypothetical protein EOD03_13565 [Mesorhizobium sp. M7A.T.Ca.TU.009.01.1.2]